MQPCIGKAVLLLRMNSVVRARGCVEDGAGIRGKRAEQLFNLRAECVVTHPIQVEAEATLWTLVPFAVVTPEPDHGVGHFADFIRLHPGIQRDGIGIHLGGEHSADPDAESHHSVVFNGVEDDVVMQQEIVLGTCDRSVPFAGQIGIFGISLAVVGQEVLKLCRVRAGVDDLLGIDASNGVAGDIPRVVEAGLDGAQTSLFKAAKDFGQISEEHASQLQVLACGDVATAFIAIALDNGSDDAKLIGRQHAIRNSQPQHEFARGLRAPKHAVPLQAQL